MRNLIAGILTCVSSITAAHAEGTHIYWMADNSTAFIATGDSIPADQSAQDGVKVTNLTLARELARLPSRAHRDTIIHTIDSNQAKELFAGTPRQLFAAGVSVLEPLTPQNVCGDFETWFASLALELRIDQPERAYIIIVSPLIDIAEKYCGDQSESETLTPELPSAPIDEYGLKAILTHESVKGVIFVGYHQKQKAVWYDALSGFGGVVPQFISIESAPQELPALIRGLK